MSGLCKVCPRNHLCSSFPSGKPKSEGRRAGRGDLNAAFGSYKADVTSDQLVFLDVCVDQARVWNSRSSLNGLLFLEGADAAAVLSALR